MITFDIQIVAKYRYNNMDIWYVDSMGIRYYRNEIEYIIANKKLPSKKSFLSRIYGVGVNINATIDKNGNIRSRRGRIETRTIKNNKVINIVIEDSNSGFQFYKTLLEQEFPDVRFKFKTASGFGGIDSTIKADSSNIDLVIMDNKSSDVRVVSIIDRIKKYKTSGIHLYTPTSLEEVILSSKTLQTYKPSIIRNAIIKYFDTGELYYTFTRGMYFIDGMASPMHNLEKELNMETTRISSIRYTKGKLSGCIITNCCPMPNYTSHCKQYTQLNKLDGMMHKSLFVGLINIVRVILGKKEIYLNKWSIEAKSRLYT